MCGEKQSQGCQSTAPCPWFEISPKQGSRVPRASEFKPSINGQSLALPSASYLEEGAHTVGFRNPTSYWRGLAAEGDSEPREGSVSLPFVLHLVVAALMKEQ